MPNASPTGPGCGLQATGEVVWEWDLEDGAIHWNNDGLSTFGYEAARGGEHFGLVDRAHPPGGALNASVTALSSRSIRASHSGKTEYRFRRKDGTYADVFARGLIVRDETGKAVRIVGSLQDITRRKRHEQEAEQLAERLQSATAAAAVGTWRLDVKTGFLRR